MKPKLEYASTGPFVSEAQTKLNALLMAQPPLRIDGKYGSKTVQRVKQFQSSRGLVADGVVGAKTWAALDSSTPAVPAGWPTQPPSGPAPPPAVGAVRVNSGATTFCDCGYAPGTLRVTEPGRTVAVIRDAVAMVNIAPFGMCRSPGNPAVVNATAAALGTLTPMPCTPVIARWWSPPGMPLDLTGKPPAPMVGLNSTLQCVFGGTIHIVSPG